MIDLPPLFSTLKQPVAGKAINGNSLPTSPGASNLGEALLQQLTQGQQLTAKVLSIKVLSTTEKTLLQQLNPRLAQQLTQQLLDITHYKGNSIHQPTRHESTQHHSAITPKLSQQLLANNTLHLVKLLVNSNQGNQPITTVTPETVNPQQQVFISKKEHQLIFTKTTSSQNLSEQFLKQNLPIQQSPTQIQQLAANIEQLPNKLISKLLPQTTVHALKLLDRFNYTNYMLSSPYQIKRSLLNNGVFLENKLSQLPKQFNIQPPTSTRQNLQPTLTLEHPEIKQDYRWALAQLNNSFSSTSDIHTADQRIIEKLLIQWFQSTATTKLTAEYSPKVISLALEKLFNLLGLPIQPQATTSNIKDLPKIIQNYIKQLAEHTQARIQFNQLRTLIPELNGNEQNTRAQVFQSELSLRFNEQLLPLHIIIQEKNEDKQQQNLEKNNQHEKKMARRWQVEMSFELPNNESLHAKLLLVEDSVSATLWAESSILCKKTQEKLHRLREKLINQGLIVSELVCLQGSPQRAGVSLTYNLIDITT